MGSQKQNLGDQVPAAKGETESMKHTGLCNNKCVLLFILVSSTDKRAYLHK